MVEEFGGDAAGADLIAQAEEVLNFAGGNELLELDAWVARFFDQVSTLLERRVAILVAIGLAMT